MNKFSADQFSADTPVSADAPAPLDAAEIAQLRAILQVVRYDARSETLRIDTGKAKLLVRGDGSVRIEGRSITQMSLGKIVLDGAAIELN